MEISANTHSNTPPAQRGESTTLPDEQEERQRNDGAYQADLQANRETAVEPTPNEGEQGSVKPTSETPRESAPTEVRDDHPPPSETTVAALSPAHGYGAQNSEQGTIIDLVA